MTCQIRYSWILNYDIKSYITCINSFAAKFKNVVWDYFHIQFYTSFKEAKNIIDQKYSFAYEIGLNNSERKCSPSLDTAF